MAAGVVPASAPRSGRRATAAGALLAAGIAGAGAGVAVTVRYLTRPSAAGGAPGPAAPTERPRRAGDIVLICDKDLICRFALPTSQPLLGYLPETMPGRPVLDLVDPAEADALRVFAERATPGSPSLPVRLRHHDAGWVEMLATRHDETALDFAPRSIPERVRMEEWLATHRALNDTILNMASDAIVSLDRDSRIVEWNHAAEVIFGWTREEALGHDSNDMIVPARLRDEYRRGLQALFAIGVARIDEPTPAILLRRDGTEIPTETTSWSVQVGQTWRFNSLIRDVTTRNHNERALTEAREKADEASRHKSEFLATMSHEIRTPMNGVIGLADVLLGTRLDSDQRRYAEGIRTAGTALLTVINDILDFSKAEAGMVVLDEIAFDVRELLEDVVDILAGRAQSKGLELVAFCRPEVPSLLLGDRGRLRQVLLNLCGNAVKFTERGEVVVTASLVSRDAGLHRIRLEVSDTGAGIKAEDTERMFDAFAQADASTTRRYGGTGLGLAISERLIEAMGGHIGVISDLGAGSMFWFEVPLSSPVGETTAAFPVSTEDLLGLRVLVVDDNATNRFVLETQLREWNMSPTAVASGQAALATLDDPQTRPFDVAVLDMAMPTMDGLELARRISTDDTHAGTYLVLLTSGPEVDPAAARDAGVGAWLTKPVHRSELFDCLARSLNPGSGARAAPSTPAATGRPVRGHVLLAEDNEVNQMVGVGLLSELGYRTDVAASGGAALELARHARYDAILMDCRMPGMDGYEATARLRDIEGETGHTPVIALTASARDEDRDRCLSAGMDDFVSKPIDRAALTRALDTWIGEAEVQLDGDEWATAPDGDGAADIDTRLTVLGGDDEGGRTLVRRVVESFLKRTPAELAALAQAVRAGDLETTTTRAHRLRGSAGNVGALSLADRCAELEAAGRMADPRAAHETLAQIEDAYRHAETTLRDRLVGYRVEPEP